MAGNVGQVERHASLVDPEVVDEVAREIQRRNDPVGKLQPLDAPRRHRKHVHLHLAAGVLVFLEQVQAGLQFAVGGFQLVAVALVLDPQVGPIQGPAHRMLEHREVFQGLDQVVGGAQTQGFHRIAHHAGSGKHDDRRFRSGLADAADQFEAVDLRHAQIANDQVRLFAFEDLQALQTVEGLQHLEVAVFQVGGEAFAHHLVVIDDQQRGTDFMHGSSRQTAPETVGPRRLL